MPDDRHGFDKRSGFNLRDQATQFTIAGSLAALVLIAAVIGISIGDGSTTGGLLSDRRPGDLTELAEDALDDIDAPTPSGDAGVVVPGSRSDGTVVGPKTPKDTVILTNEVIKVGIPYVSDPGQANAAAGFTGIGQVDQRRGWEAVIKDINANAPYGRKIVPVWHPMTEGEATSQGIERMEQEACARFTQDDPVFMVWDGSLGLDTLHTCLTKARIPEVGGGGGLAYSKTYERYPFVLHPGSAGMDRMARFQVDQLVKQKFFSEFKQNEPPYTPQKPVDGKARIGLIRYDQPSWDAGAAALKDQLKKHKLALCDGCEFEVTYSASDVPNQLNDATEVNAAIQQCKSRGCTHLLFLGSTAGVRITIFYADGAERQQYRPRLGFNAYDAPTAARDFLGEASYPQFQDSRLVTWDPADFETKVPAYKTCKEIFMKAGETFEGDEASAKEGQIPGYCDTAWYTRAVFEAAGPRLSLDTFMKGAETLDPIDSASTYLMRTTKDRHDGASAIRVGGWNDSCACYKPLTGVIPV